MVEIPLERKDIAKRRNLESGTTTNFRILVLAVPLYYFQVFIYFSQNVGFPWTGTKFMKIGSTHLCSQLLVYLLRTLIAVHQHI